MAASVIAHKLEKKSSLIKFPPVLIKKSSADHLKELLANENLQRKIQQQNKELKLSGRTQQDATRVVDFEETSFVVDNKTSLSLSDSVVVDFVETNTATNTDKKQIANNNTAMIKCPSNVFYNETVKPTTIAEQRDETAAATRRSILKHHGKSIDNTNSVSSETRTSTEQDDEEEEGEATRLADEGPSSLVQVSQDTSASFMCEFDEFIFTSDVATPALEEPEVFDISGSSASLIAATPTTITGVTVRTNNNSNNVSDNQQLTSVSGEASSDCSCATTLGQSTSSNTGSGGAYTKAREYKLIHSMFANKNRIDSKKG